MRVQNLLIFTTLHKKYEFTKEELNRYGMAYVFNNKGFKVEEVEE